MAGLQRSAMTFRRSGSSGLVWDERFLTECGAGRPELRHSRSVGGTTVLRRGAEVGGGHDDDDDKKRRPAELLARPPKQKEHVRQKPRRQQEEVVAPAGRKKAFRTRDVAPAAEPPSPRVPGCCAPCAILRGSAAARSSSSSLARRARTKR